MLLGADALTPVVVAQLSIVPRVPQALRERQLTVTHTAGTRTPQLVICNHMTVLLCH